MLLHSLSVFRYSRGKEIYLFSNRFFSNEMFRFSFRKSLVPNIPSKYSWKWKRKNFVDAGTLFDENRYIFGMIVLWVEL